jgi:hypothetical protein
VNVETIRSFLAKRPRPAKLRVVGSTGDREIKVVAGQNWTMVSKTVSALEPETIEAFDDAGTLLRATNGDEDDESTTRNAARAVAKGGTDPESIRFNAFAAHIAEAYRFATEVAFARMVDLFEAVTRLNAEQSKSLENMQKILGKMYQERVDEALEAAESADPTSALIGAFVQGKTQGMADHGPTVARPNGNSNGKVNQI